MDNSKTDGWAWPRWSFGTAHRSWRERVSALLWTGLWLIYLIDPVTETFSQPHSSLFRTIALVLIAGYGISYLIVTVAAPNAANLNRVFMIVWLALFPIGLTILFGSDQLVFYTYVVAPAMMFLPRYVGFSLTAFVVAGSLIFTGIVDHDPDWTGAMILVVTAVAVWSFSTLFYTIRQLKSTQEKMAALAVAEERSRLARDLHDVLGHSLTTVTVKAGLARRILESAVDRDRAIAEVRDVEELARQALADVRATVSGYRTPSLSAELVGARAALEAAGIAADLPHAVDNVNAGLQETFAYALREGITNVIRHSGASRCEVRLGDTWLEVRDNGQISPETVMQSRDAAGGNGLAGLAERVHAIKGELEAHLMPTGGFLLRISAPMLSKPQAGDGVPKPIIASATVELT